MPDFMSGDASAPASECDQAFVNAGRADAANDAQGRPSSMAEAVAEHDDLARYLRRSGASAGAAEELASEAIARLWASEREGFAPSSRQAYLRTVGRRLLIDLVRRERRERARNEAIATQLRLEAVAAGHGDPQNQILGIAVKVAMARLPPRSRQVVACTLDGQMMLEQTAVALRLPSAGAAGVLAHRARKALAMAVRDQRGGEEE